MTLLTLLMMVWGGDSRLSNVKPGPSKGQYTFSSLDGGTSMVFDPDSANFGFITSDGHEVSPRSRKTNQYRTLASNARSF